VLIRGTGVVLEYIGHGPGFPPSILNGVPSIENLSLSERLSTLTNQACHPKEHPAPIGCAHARPHTRLKRSSGRSERIVEVTGTRPSNRSDGVPRGGIEDLKGGAVSCQAALTSDKELVD
jgi:hypothetical protein